MIVADIPLFDLLFFRRAFVAVCFISVAAGIIGTYIVTRRLVALCGGITHSCFGGLGAGYFLGINPVATAAVVAIASALSVDWMSERWRMRSDSAIAVVWALGMALGVVFVFLTPGYVPELNAFLFGNILTVTEADIWIYAAFTAVVAGFMALRCRMIAVCAFDSDFAAVSGLPVRAVNTAMTILTALCIVLTIRMVGVMLLMSMLTLPQLVAELFCRRYASMTVAAVIVAALCGIGGLLVSAFVDIPCSALMVTALVAAYAATASVCAVRRRHRRLSGQ